MKRFIEFSEENSKYGTIYVDMDGVLCDFIKRVKDVTGTDYKDPDLNHMSKSETKQKINRYDKFWHEMPWHEGGQELWRFVAKQNPKILSAHANWDANSIPGKYYWTKKNLNIPKSQVLLVKRDQKKDYATDGNRQNILIDDYIKNIREFESAGGIGIHHTSVQNTINTLKKLGF